MFGGGIASQTVQLGVKRAGKACQTVAKCQLCCRSTLLLTEHGESVSSLDNSFSLGGILLTSLSLRSPVCTLGGSYRACRSRKLCCVKGTSPPSPANRVTRIFSHASGRNVHVFLCNPRTLPPRSRHEKHHL